MDILDIDEALKDDSFIFLEDKTHDDVSNILQQWKSNNCMQQQQQQQEQAYKLNSRTFTRPKRKLVQNLESQFSTHSNLQQCNGSPMLSLEIGGLVTTMQKSFLQDTSPPASICSSMDASIDRMNNSLITSADFINVNFLQSGLGQDFINDSLSTSPLCVNKTTPSGYTLSDMIRDRKALESLTLSGDGTLIKDCNIGQIDDISITLSKTASNCSTMDNSTESVDTNNTNNRTLEMVRDAKFINDHTKIPVMNADNEILHKTVLISDEMIGDTTLNLVENSMYSEKGHDKPIVGATDETKSVMSAAEIANETFKKPAPLDETVFINKANFTYECLPLTPETNCDTPECEHKNAVLNNFSESTPQIYTRQSKRHCTPSATIDEGNISPIIAVGTRLNATRILCKTFECDPKLKESEEQINSETFSGTLPDEELNEFLTNPNGTFNRSIQKLDRTEADIAMQNVMNLAQAEAELLAENEDEEEFEHMLDEFSKVELNPDQLKMKKSLDIIKKRFTYGLTEKHDRELSREAKDMQEMLKNCAEGHFGDVERVDTQEEINCTGTGLENELKKRNNSIQENGMNLSFHKTLNGSQLQNDIKECSSLSTKESPKELGYSPTSSLSVSTMSRSGSGTERLLSRRSRLYDNINLSSVSAKSPGNSFSLQKSYNNEDIAEELKTTEVKIENDISTDETEICSEDKTTDEASQVVKKDIPRNLEKNTRRFIERRERDRDRFKTIEIVKQRTADGEEIGERLNVPCIDDMLIEPPEATPEISTEVMDESINQRCSRRDHNSPPSNCAESESNGDKERTNANTNYLTYKKPREKPVRNNPPEILAAETSFTPTSSTAPPTRSLSRPRYISGLQKFGVVSKATSAGDLEKTSRAGAMSAKPSNLIPNSVGGGLARKISAFSRPQPNENEGNGKKELKSPMGIKSKSFHNLSSNFGGSVGLPQKSNLYGLRKTCNTTGVLTEKQIKTNQTRAIPSQSDHAARTAVNVTQQQQQKEKCDERVFKVPKLVSGIRAPSNVKRAGLMRPSSGYYSLNALATAKSVPQTVDIEIEADRQSPTDSMSSASSSRSSLHSSTSGLKPPNSIPPSAVAPAAVVPDDGHLSATALTKITTGATGIPKPSGLRPPSKRSGLPRPASILKR